MRCKSNEENSLGFITSTLSPIWFLTIRWRCISHAGPLKSYRGSFPWRMRRLTHWEKATWNCLGCKTTFQLPAFCVQFIFSLPVCTHAFHTIWPVFFFFFKCRGSIFFFFLLSKWKENSNKVIRCHIGFFPHRWNSSFWKLLNNLGEK